MILYTSDSRQDCVLSILDFLSPAYAFFQREFTYSDHPILYNIQNNVIGHDLVIKGPYGERPGK